MDKVPIDPEGPPLGEQEDWPPKKEPKEDPGGWDPDQPKPKVQPKPPLDL